MSAYAESTIDILAARACDALAKLPDDVVFPAVVALPLGVGIDWNEHGNATTYQTPREIFPDAEAFREALTASTKVARICAFPALSALDKESAAAIFGEVVVLRTENFYAMSYPANLVRAMWTHWQDLMPLLPAEVPGTMWLEGRYRFEALTDAQIAALPADALRKKLDSLDGGELSKVLALHAAFRETATKKQILAEMLAAKRLGPAAALTGLLVAARDPEAPELAARYFAASHRGDYAAVDLVIDAHHVPSLERLFAELPEVHEGKRLGWDPHHTDAELRPSIRAGLALDPSRASVRFASYFDDAAVASDAGAKVAHDVWMLAAGRVVSHDGTELSSGDGDILSRDPGWFPIAARLSAHRRLGKIAKSILSRLSRADRAELVARVPATPAAEAPAKRPAAKKPPAKKPPAKKPAAKPAAKRSAPKRAGAKTK